MIDFAREFLREGKRLFGREAAPAITFATFGKHPGWDDHMDDIGLETETLLLAKQLLYLDGIGGLVNSGEWDKLGEAQRLPGFDHFFLWKREGAFLLGRMWPSQDGKGRAKYPMIACAHCRGVSLAAAFTKILPVIEKFERQCREKKTDEEVREAYRVALQELSLLTFGEASDAAIPPERLSTFVAEIAPRGDEEGFLRVLFRLRSEAAEHFSLRLPAAPKMVRESFSYWSRFLEAKRGTALPILMTMPQGANWLDATIGRPERADLYSLRAGPEAAAVVSTVAFEMDENFRREQAAPLLEMHSGREFTKPARFGLPWS